MKPVHRALAPPLHELSARGETCLNLTLERWSLWQPGAPAEKPWPGGAVIPGESERRALDFLPVMQRRRLSPLARAAMSVAWDCRGDLPEMPAVFYSRHGESGHYLEMLNELAAGEELSPSRFSLSVHNAVAGLYSLCRASQAPCVCLAGSGDDLFSAFLEAAGMLAEDSCERVLLVLYEQPLPEVYRAYADGPTRVAALGMRLSAPGPGTRLRLWRDSSQERAQGCQIERLCDAVRRGERRSAPGSAWRWELSDD